MNEITGQVIYQERKHLPGGEEYGGVLVCAAHLPTRGDFVACYVIQGYSWHEQDSFEVIADVVGFTEHKTEAEVLREAIKLFDEMWLRLTAKAGEQ